MRSQHGFAFAAMVAAAVVAFQPAAQGESYPAKPIRFVVPFPPGGSADLVARTVGAKLSEAVGQPVVVENKVGGGGQLGVDATIKSPPDGYTLLVTPNGPIVVTRHLSTLPYDVAVDLAPVSMLAVIPAGLAVNAALPIKSVADFLKYAKEKPGAINYGVPTYGTHMHLAGEMLKMMAGIDMVPVPYKGTGPAAAAVAAGEIQASVGDLASLLPVARQGNLRILAVTDPKRVSVAPDLPTVAEAGVPGYGASAWIAAFAPKGVAPAVVARLNAEMGKVMADADVKRILTNVGVEPAHSTPAGLTETVRDDTAKWGKVIKDGNIKLN